MATHAYPTSRIFIPATMTWGIRSNVFASTSPYSGDVQTIEIPGARWTCSLSYPTAINAEQAQLEAFWTKVRGQVHRVSLWHMMRPAPRGTMRGSPTLSAGAAQGATSVSVVTTSGNTLLAGDMVGIGGQLHMVVSDATASGGLMTISIEPPLRASRSSGAPVTWDRPTALFMLAESQSAVPYAPKLAPGFGIDLVEVFA